MPVLHIHDETTAGDRTGETVLEFLTERITVRELIRGRVYQEVQDYNLKGVSGPFNGLVKPEAEELELNGPRKSHFREIDWNKQFEIACNAFQSSRVLVLVNDRQAESLDEEIVVTPSTEAVFLRLVALVGG